MKNFILKYENFQGHIFTDEFDTFSDMLAKIDTLAKSTKMEVFRVEPVDMNYEKMVFESGLEDAKNGHKSKFYDDSTHEWAYDAGHAEYHPYTYEKTALFLSQ